DLTAENASVSPRACSVERFSCGAISPDSRWMVIADRTARVWDLMDNNAGANPRVFDGHPPGVATVAISPDGRWLLTRGWDFKVCVWDLSAQHPDVKPQILGGGDSPIFCMAIS